MIVFYRPQHLKFNPRAAMRRFRVQVVVLTMAVLMALTAAVALADPDFGTGESEKKNNDPGAVCSPSKIQDADLAQCK